MVGPAVYFVITIETHIEGKDIGKVIVPVVALAVLPHWMIKPLGSME